jgi:putative phosphoesterase
MKICIVSDSHDASPMLAAAVERARAAGAQAVLHCGDIIGPNTLRAAMRSGLAMHVVHGNNLGDVVALTRLAAESGGRLTYHGGDASLVRGERRLFMVHYPHLARGMAATGDYDVVLCGHSHTAAIEQQANVRGGRTWLINPGTVAGIGAPATFVLGDLAALTFSIERVDPSTPRAASD